MPDLYKSGHGPDCPVACMDEKSKQSIGGTRGPIPMKAGRAAKFDCEYKRNGTKNLFVAVGPKGGRHMVEVTGTRAKKDFAHFTKRLADGFCPGAKKVRAVPDNLNTHFEKSIVGTFPGKEAERIPEKVEFFHTPVHASWLDMAEMEIGILEKECLNRRMAGKKEMIHETKAWMEGKNREEMKINWSFAKRDAYKKPSHGYVS